MTTVESSTPVDRIRATLDAGWQLPASLYRSPEAFEQEMHHVFRGSWQYVGRERDLSDTGSFITAELGEVPVVITRSAAGELRGHVNVCRHRLHPVAQGSGCKQLLQCVYHGWTYTLDGDLRAAPGVREEEGFDKSALGLRPVRVDTFNGFVFANTDVTAPPLRDFLADGLEAIAGLDLDFADWEYGGTYTYEVPANWKLFTENALECYHCSLVHQDTYATVFETDAVNYVCSEFTNVAIQTAPVTTRTEAFAARDRDCSEQLEGFKLAYVWPSTAMSVDDFVGIVGRTVPIGPRESRFVVDTFIKPGTDPELVREWIDLYDRTFEEDKTVVSAQQAGYDSGAVDQGRLMTNCESTISMFHRRTWAALETAWAAGEPASQPAAPRTVNVSEPTPGTSSAEWEADLRVDSIVAEADDVVSVTLVSPDGAALPAWRPGAHIDLCLGSGITRQYSLCGDPGTSGAWTIAVLWAAQSRGGSAAVHELAIGDSVRIRGPRNRFELPSAESYVFVAGGIGITPILPMVEAVESDGKPWQLHYGGRSQSSLAMTDRLAIHQDKVHLQPADTCGTLDLHAILAPVGPETAIVACGPAPMLDAIESICGEKGLTLHTERFSPRARPEREAIPIDLTLARSGVEVRVAADESVLEAVRAAGVTALSSCGEGTCGTCETSVLAGAPDHRDTVLTDAERLSNDTMMICVSRCTSDRLVLDL